MKVLAVLVSISTLALASLEPAGYRPPGSSASSQYLPPRHQQQQKQQQPHHHHHQSHSSSPGASNQYLPPTYNRQSSATAPARPISQYLPPQQRPHIPSSNYLPASDKPLTGSVPPPPSNDYLPPSLPASSIRPQVLPSSTPTNEYLPPIPRSQTTPRPLTNDYLPPRLPTVAALSNEYLPPLASTSRAPSPIPPRTEYLPPLEDSRPSTPAVPPTSDYLPPNRQSNPQRLAAPTPVAKISAIAVSPYKLDGPHYSQPQRQQQQYQQRQSQFSGSGLATSSPAKPYAQSGYSPALKSSYSGSSSYEQPSDNYLPPSSGSHRDSQEGYNYAAADSRNSISANLAEQTTVAAKYDFEYRVSDEFGNDFGHKETRAGAQTQGVYSVLLPDGRKQIVHYEADENGFKPRITYEEAASVLGSKTPAAADTAAFGAGYDKNANSLDSRGPY